VASALVSMYAKIHYF